MDGLDNRLQHSGPVAEDFRVPEPKNAVPFRAQPFVSLLITCRTGCVLAAIDLDNQSLLLTYEIDDEWPDRHLPSKAQTGETMSTKHEPQEALGIGHFRAQSLCAAALKF